MLYLRAPIKTHSLNIRWCCYKNQHISQESEENHESPQSGYLTPFWDSTTHHNVP